MRGALFVLGFFLVIGLCMCAVYKKETNSNLIKDITENIVELFEELR